MGLEKIADMRKKAGLSLDELSALSGVPKGTLSKISAGITKNPSIETIKAIVHCMGYTLDDLEEKEKSPEAAGTAPEDQPITLEESNALLVKLGYIKPGEQLSDDDLAFLTHLIGLLDAWFDRH